ncbi:hypothetical protein JHK87_045154 [Glycine soja]|nr:hypothetical protein JHK87_045154 [Glycine soja]
MAFLHVCRTQNSSSVSPSTTINSSGEQREETDCSIITKINDNDIPNKLTENAFVPMVPNAPAELQFPVVSFLGTDLVLLIINNCIEAVSVSVWVSVSGDYHRTGFHF